MSPNAFTSLAGNINDAINAAFGPDIEVIGEPGRYFAEYAATFACNIYGRRVRGDASGPTYDYWVGDGVYGSMNCILYDHAVLHARPLANPLEDSTLTAFKARGGRVERWMLPSSGLPLPSRDA